MTKSKTFFEMKVSIRGFLTAAGALFCLATLAGFGELYWWVLDLFAHFRVQYFLGLAVLVLLLALLHRRRTAIVFTLFALVNLALIAPLYFGGPEALGDVATTRAMLINVNRTQGDPVRVIEVISKFEPDFIVIEEINKRWLDDLKILEKSYPYSVSRPRGDNFGIAMFSRIPFEFSKIVYISAVDFPSVIARIEINGSPLTVLGTHPIRPGNKRFNRMRDEQLDATPGFLKGIDTPLLVLGDLNTTPWSFRFKRLLRETGLLDSSEGRGIQTTWPTMLFLLRIPLDHCLHSSDISIHSKEIGPHVGSDHFPVIVDFALSD